MIRVDIEYQHLVNWSLLRAGVPLIRSLELTAVAGPVRGHLTVCIENVFELRDLPIDLKAREKLRIDTFAAAVHFSNAAGICEHESLTWLKVECEMEGAALNKPLRFPVVVAPLHEWRTGLKQGFMLDTQIEWTCAFGTLPVGGLVKPAPATTGLDEHVLWSAAALVMPDHEAVQWLKRASGEFLAQNGWQEASPKDVLTAVCRAIGEYRDKFQSDFSPPVHGRRSSNIRLPHKLRPDPHFGRRSASCMDLALLVAATMESCGHDPLILIVNNNGMAHALPACWSFDGPLGQPTAFERTIIFPREWPEIHNSVLVADTFELIASPYTDDAFAAARKFADKALEGGILYAINIPALRHNGVAPIPWRGEAGTVKLPAPRDADAGELQLQAGGAIDESRFYSAAQLSESVSGRPLLITVEYGEDVPGVLEDLLLPPRRTVRVEMPVGGHLVQLREDIVAVRDKLNQIVGPRAVVVDFSSIRPTDENLQYLRTLWLNVMTNSIQQDLRPIADVVLIMPRWLRVETSTNEALAQIRPTEYRSASLYSSLYSDRGDKLARAGPVLRSIASCNSPALFTVLRDFLENDLPDDFAGVLDPTAATMGEFARLSKLLFERGFYEAAFRLEIACHAALRHDPEINLTADIYRDFGGDHQVVEYADDVSQLPIHLQNCYSRLVGEEGAGKATTLARIERYWAAPDASSVKKERSFIPIQLRTSHPKEGVETAFRATFAGRRFCEDFTFTCHSFLAEADKPSVVLSRLLTSPRFYLVGGPAAKNRYFAFDLDRVMKEDDGALLATTDPRLPPLPQGRTIKVVRIRDMGASQLGAAMDALRKSGSSGMRSFLHTPRASALAELSLTHAHTAPSTLEGLVRLAAELRAPALRDANRCHLAEAAWDQISQSLFYLDSNDYGQATFASGSLLTWSPEDAFLFRFSQPEIRDLLAAEHFEADEHLTVSGLAADRLSEFKGCLAMVAARFTDEARPADFISELLQKDPAIAGFCYAHLSREFANSEAFRPVRAKLAELLGSDSLSFDAKAELARTLGIYDPRIHANNPAATLLPIDPSDSWVSLGRFPVTNMEFAEFVQGGGYANFDYWTPAGKAWLNRGYREPLAWRDEEWSHPNYPVTGVSFHEAVAYCRWLTAKSQTHTFQLPRARDWETATFGPEAVIQDWFSRLDVILLRSRIVNILAEQTATPMTPDRDPANSLHNQLRLLEDRVQPYVGQLRNLERSPVGLHEANSRGFHDLISATWEWCDTALDDEYERPSSSSRSVLELPLIVKGGGATPSSPSAHLIAGGWMDADTRFEKLGFRVSATPLPLDI